MSEATQALCFMAGANSIFTGDKLLTTGNRGDNADAALFAKLGLRPMVSEEPMRMEAAERKFPLLLAGGVRGGPVTSETISNFANGTGPRSEEHTSELQSLMRYSYDVFC